MCVAVPRRGQLHGPGTGVPAKTGVANQVTGWEIIREMLSYIWPRDERGIKARVVTAMGLLIGAKVSRTRRLKASRSHAWLEPHSPRLGLGPESRQQVTVGLFRTAATFA